ncbi:MAG: glycosyltransferase [Calditrichaeota bacterium]|nr:glycosyltransferase [Calditrichota bacterium]
MILSDVTLIIPTKNEEKNIQTFLSSLPSGIKLIVVDASTDRTRELINIQRPYNTHVMHELSTIPRARQSGADNAVTEWLLYSDADMSFDTKYFIELEKMAVSANVGAIMGAKKSKNKYRWYYFLYSNSIRIFSYLGIPIGSGSNMLLKKEALDAIGGFDFALTHSEDNDILMRIKKAGWHVIYNGKLRVYENDHRRLDQGVFKKFWHGTLRAFLLYTGILKERVRESDWGYWQKKDSIKQ